MKVKLKLPIWIGAPGGQLTDVLELSPEQFQEFILANSSRLAFPSSILGSGDPIAVRLASQGIQGV